MTSLSISHVTKHFGPTKVISDISFEVGAGEFFSLLGPSGCGKSTLLRIIAGLEEADSGSVAVNGSPINHVPPQNRGIGMVFQQYALWPHMTIAQNVRFGLETQAISNKERDQRMLSALDRVQMTEFRERYPHQISGGQQQRVALARALAMQPSIILLDEPLSNLDARLRAEIRDELAELHLKLGTTMVYVTHDQEDALALSTRLAIMNRGTIEQVGTPQEVYQSPASPFCARFIGDANLVPCTIVEQMSPTVARVALDMAPGTSFQVRRNSSGTVGSASASATKGYVCIRPSSLAVEPVADEPRPSTNALQATVVRSSYKGSVYDIEVVTSNDFRLRGSCRASGSTAALSPGSAVTLSWSSEDSAFISERP
jgi:ABC-type Fe3+/spermidine/putrescine transport system ATPase subunit